MATASPKLTSGVLFLPSPPHCRKLPLLLSLRHLTAYPVNPLILISSPISLCKITCKATEASVAEDKGGGGGGGGGVSDEKGKNWVLVVPSGGVVEGRAVRDNSGWGDYTVIVIQR
ncbi:hypothetical protein CsSME_00001737 [Camellia sinensis var. sinensis]